MRTIVCFALFTSCLIGDLAVAQSSPKSAKIRIVLAGDSTVASFPNPPADRPTLAGWGQVFDEFFNDDVEVVNLARSGASSKSFRSLGLWDKVLAERGDYVFIQFGHNDGPGKGDRATDPKTEFLDNLRRFIDEVRAEGGKPVLVTSVARRTFVDGKIQGSLGPHVEATIAVGREKQVPVVDLHAAGEAMFNRLGDEGSADFSPGNGDRTHFSRDGAVKIARLVVDALPTAVPELNAYLKPRN
jgi:lysophospholipase L1-like esterase